MGYSLVTPPSAEPLTRQEVKAQLQIGSVDGSGTHPHDSMIDGLIASVRQFAEQETQRSLITQTWRYTADSFPGGQGAVQATPWGQEFSLPETAFCLTKGPVTAITSIKYVDMGGTQQTMSQSGYAVDLTGPLARVTPVFGSIWPIPLPQIGAVTVDFTAGYGASGSSVPAAIRTWMMLRLRAIYDNPTGIGQGLEPAPWLDSMLDPFRIQVA